MLGLDARGSNNIFRYNTIEANTGAGIRFGGHTIDGLTYGRDNEAYNNVIADNDYAALKIEVRTRMRERCARLIIIMRVGWWSGKNIVGPRTVAALVSRLLDSNECSVRRADTHTVVKPFLRRSASQADTNVPSLDA